MRMTKSIVLLATLAALAACASDDGTAPPEEQVVSMPGFSFVPFTTTVPVGGTVTFDFPSEPHNVIFARVTGAPSDIQATTNARVKRTFPTAGTFPFDCTIHPGMSGVVVAR
jgi:plastocyanin